MISTHRGLMEIRMADIEEDQSFSFSGSDRLGEKPNIKCFDYIENQERLPKTS